MKLKNYINKHILKHPSLYKAKDYNKSRLLVLDHIFITNGNAIALMDVINEPDEEYEVPSNYFNVPIWKFEENEFDKKVWKELKDNGFKGELVENWFNGIKGFILQCNIETAKKLYINNYSMLKPLPLEWEAYEYENCYYRPYPLCEYSILCSIVNGQEPLGGRIIDINKIPNDWIEGMKEVAKAYLNFLDNHVEMHHGYPTKKLLQEIQKETTYYKEDMEKYGTSNVIDLFKMKWEEEEKWLREQLNKALNI